MKKPKVVIIAAISKNRGLGYKNNLLFKNKDDMRFFKDCTLNNTVIMGRKTFESLKKKPLTERDNYIISQQTKRTVQLGIPPYSYSFHGDLKSAFYHSAKHCPNNTIYIIGGGTIYEQCLSITDEIYLSEFDEHKQADVFFPELDPEVWYCYDVKNFEKFSIRKYKRF